MQVVLLIALVLIEAVNMVSLIVYSGLVGGGLLLVLLIPILLVLFTERTHYDNNEDSKKDGL